MTTQFTRREAEVRPLDHVLFPVAQSQVLPRLRALAALAVTAGSALLLASWLDRSLEFSEWFFFDLAKIWLWDLYLTAACGSFGHLIISRLVPVTDRTPLETAALSLVVGLIGFVAGMYLGGFLALFGPVFAVALPTSMLAVGCRGSLSALSAASFPRKLSPSGALGWAFGLFALGLLYLGLLAPDALNYDAAWNHLVIAQDYARAGRIIPFRGDWVKDLPHLGSIVNAWAFMLPGFDMPALRWMMALHNEFTVLLWTLVGVAATARFLAQREVAGTWAVLFLFPGIFVYDGNLGGAADHFLALFAAPLFLTTARALRRFEPSWCVLSGAMAGGAFLTKIHALYLGVPVAAFVLVSAARAVVARARGRTDAPPVAATCRGLALMGGTILLLMAPYFIGHLVFFKNPVYPLLLDVFPGSEPAGPDAAFQFKNLLVDWRWHPPLALSERVLKAVELTFTFSFVPHYSFFGNLPVFGSLFTLSLPLLFVIQDARRLRVAALVALGALFTWAFTFWVDRNLQTFLPLLVAITAAVFVRTWELGLPARVGIGLLVLVQTAWASSLYFSGSERIAAAIALLRSGMDGKARERLSEYRRPYVELGASLPENAIVLLHSWHGMLGIDRPVLLDLVGFQGLIDYRPFRTSRDLYDRYRSLGVTHVVSVPGHGSAPSRQEEVLFQTFAARYGGPKQRFGGLEVFPLPASAPPVEAPYRALLIGIPDYRDGLYPVETLSTVETLPPTLRSYAAPARASASPFTLLADADSVLIGTSVIPDPAAAARLRQDFASAATYPGFRVLVRHPPAPQSSASVLRGL
jgi:hypothetical protein